MLISMMHALVMLGRCLFQNVKYRVKISLADEKNLECKDPSACALF